MTSHNIENDHNAKLRQILHDQNLFGVFDDTNLFEKSEGAPLHVPKDTAEMESSRSSIDEAAGETEERYVPLPGEYFGEMDQEAQIPFPPPSLRRPLPRETRELMKLNRMSVLPEEFSAIANPELIPDVAEYGAKETVDVLAKLLECENYQHNMAEYWFLDTLTLLLLRAQKDKMDKANQGSLVSWFCEFVKEVQEFDAADRDRALRRLKANALLLASRLSEVDVIPTPAELGIIYKAPDSPSDPDTTEVHKETPTLVHTAVSRDLFIRNLKNTLRILHYIFDIFGTDFQYNLIRSIFTDTPDYKLINLPHKINFSKSLYAPKPTTGKSKTKSKKGSSKETKVKSEVLPEDYIELMLLKANEQQELADIEAKEMAAKELASHILPLSMAVDQEFFHKYWPNSPVSKSSKKKK